MAVSRVPSPPPQEASTPVAENWCYTQVCHLEFKSNFNFFEKSWVTESASLFLSRLFKKRLATFVGDCTAFRAFTEQPECLGLFL